MSFGFGLHFCFTKKNYSFQANIISNQVIPTMPSIKHLEDRMDICCENIRSRISLMEAYACDAHAVNIQGLMSLFDINNHIIMCDNTIRIIGELKNLLKDEDR